MPIPLHEIRVYHDIEEYAIGEPIGSGSFGTVYEVTRGNRRRRKYAMKVPIGCDPRSDDYVDVGKIKEEDKELWQFESETQAELSNRCEDSVIRLEDYGTMPFPWMVMEYAEKDFAEAIEDGSASIRDVIVLLRKLDTIHRKGYCHFDIKPENIMKVGPEWKFSDFGLSNPIKSASSSGKGLFEGTKEYAAPEQISKKEYGERDHRTDIWQMAVVCYRVLTRREPYDYDDPLELIRMITDGGPDLQHVSGEYRSVLSKAFMARKIDRYQSAKEFADALETCLKRNNTDDGKSLNDGSISGTGKIVTNEIKDLYSSAMDGDADAQFELGMKYVNGTDVVQSDAEALKWFRKAADQGIPEAQYNLGVMYSQGLGAEHSDAEALKWYTQAAEQGYAKAQYNLGVMYAAGQGVKQSHTKAAKWYAKAAEQGIPEAQFSLGRQYKYGVGVKQSRSEAEKWYSKAAEQGYVPAKKALEMLDSVTWKDVDRDATEISSDAGQESKGLPNTDGDIPPEITGELRETYMLAIEGYAESQYNLAVCYDNGKGVPKDHEKALQWYTEAAEHGNIVAQYRLGLMYSNGEGVPEDMKEAFKWFKMAAEQGDEDAQFNLGLMYYMGQGVKKSPEESAKWLKLAADQYHEGASKLLKEVKKELLSEPKGPKTEYGISKIPKRLYWKLPDEMHSVYEEAMAGDTKSQIRMGKYCFDSNDGKNALNWLTEASKKNGEAFIWLYRCYMVGANGIPCDSEIAHSYLDKAKGLGYDVSNVDIDTYSNDEMKLYRAAIRGDADAQYRYGMRFTETDGGKKGDPKQAMDWFLRAANNHNTSAQLIIGMCYETGTIVDVNMKEAVRWYTIASNHGNAASQYRLGLCYEYGKGVNKNLKEAEELYAKAGSNGHNDAIEALDRVRNQFSTVPTTGEANDIQKTSEKIRSSIPSSIQKTYGAAVAGDTRSQIELGIYSFESDDGEGALYWFTEASKNDAEAFIWLFRCYMIGLNGVPRDPEKAKNYLNEAKRQGHDLKASDIDYNSAENIEIYRKAIEGDPEAQYRLGGLYSSIQDNHKSNPKESAKWYMKAADKGHASAQYCIGLQYQSGLGVKKDLDMAIKWFGKAAEQGHAGSQYRLGFCYENGKGVEADLKMAEKFYTKAAAQGHKDAMEDLKRLQMERNGISNISSRGYWTLPSSMKRTFDAAMDGDAASQMEMGKYCYRTRNKEAVDWFTEASKKMPLAYLWLYYCYSKNRLSGVQKDNTKADYYLQLARNNGHDLSEIQSEIESMTAEDDNKKAPASEERKPTKKDDEVKIYSSDNVKDAALRKEAESREERRGGFFDKLFKKR